MNELIIKIMDALDNCEALNYDNVSIEGIKNIIADQLKDYVIIEGEVISNNGK